MSRWAKWVFLVVCLAIYLNIGWAIGGYVYDNVAYTDSSELQTMTAKFLAGPGQYFTNPDTPDTSEGSRMSRTSKNFIYSLLWLPFIGMVIVTWIFWIAFLGGLAKLIGFA